MRTAREKKDQNNKTDYTMGGKIKIKNTYIPKDKPSYEAWIKELHTSEVVYLNHPDAKPKADKIMENVGIEVDCRTLWEVLTGASIEESVNYVPEPVKVTR